MREDSEREKFVRDWLSTGDVQAMVRKAAGSVLRIMREKKLSYVFIGLEGTTLADEALLEDIESELRLFILENRRGIRERLMLAGRKAGWILLTAFLQHWLDATRSPKSDPWRYLYKRTVDILRESADARIKTGPSGSARGTFYSMARESVDIAEPSEVHVSTIVPPRSLLPALTFEALSKADVLAGLAAHFWQQLSEQYGQKPVWIPIKTFINWIASQVPVEKAQATEVGREEPDPLQHIPNSHLGQELLSFDREEIRRWAQKFANLMTKKERVAFELHLGQSLTLEQVADQMGYGGPSGPEYHINKAKEKLKRFLSDLPWLSPPDLNEEAWAFFVDALLSPLKKQEP